MFQTTNQDGLHDFGSHMFFSEQFTEENTYLSQHNRYTHPQTASSFQVHLISKMSLSHFLAVAAPLHEDVSMQLTEGSSRDARFAVQPIHILRNDVPRAIVPIIFCPEDSGWSSPQLPG